MLSKLIFSSLLIAKVLCYTKFYIEEEVDGTSTFKSTFSTQLVHDLDCSLASTVTVTEGPAASTQTVFVMVDLDGVQLIAGTASAKVTEETSCTDELEGAAGSVASSLVAGAEKTTFTTKTTAITSTVGTEPPCESSKSVATGSKLDPSGYSNTSGTTVLSTTTVANGTTILETASTSSNGSVSTSASFSSSPINSTTTSNSEMITTGFASLTSFLSTTSTSSLSSSDSSTVSAGSVSQESSTSTISTTSASSSDTSTSSIVPSSSESSSIVIVSTSSYRKNTTYII